MPSIIFNTNRNNLDIVAKGKYLPTLKEFISIGITFSLTVFAWIFFRAADVTHAFSYISKIFSSSLFTIPHGIGIDKSIMPLIVLFFIIEWLGREEEYAFKIIANIRLLYFRVILYYIVIITILLFGNFIGNQFIYFQF